MSLARLGRDPFVAGALALCVVPLAAYAVPGVPMHAKGMFAGHVADPLFIALALLAVLLAMRRDGEGRPRRFWAWIATGLALWGAASLLQSSAPFFGFGPGVQRILDSVYLGSCLAWLLAADRRPHLADGAPVPDALFRYGVAGGLLFVLGLIVYFEVLPAVGLASHAMTTPTGTALFLALDLMLALRFALTAWRAGEGAWRRRYATIAFACAGFAASDLLNGMLVAGRLTVPFGTPLDVVWWIPFVALTVAARLGARPGAIPAVRPDRRSESPELLVMYGVLFPVVHLTLATLQLLPPSGRELREVLVLACLLAFVGLAAAQQAALERRNRELRMRIDDLATNEKLQHAQKMEAIGRLAGGVAHDFNNLLTVVRGRAEQIRQGMAAEDPRRAGVDAILHASERGAGITHRLLAFSRAQVLNPEVLDLNRVLRDGEGVLRALLGEDHPLSLDLADRLSPVEADGHQIFQVVLNLAANARDANAGGGRIVIRTRDTVLSSEEPGVLPSPRAGRYVALVVEDSGHGMDEATRRRVFEPFFTKKTGGTGLGLATVYGIVVQSGGHVRLHSALGEGTTFEVFLPSAGAAAEPEPEPAPSGAAEAAAGSAHERWVVLLVEDQEAVREVARDLLESWGFAVVDAASASSALAAWEERGGRIDVLLSDVVMPGMRGPELAGRLREARADLPVVFMSGYADAGDELVQLQGPRAGFVAKPFTGAQLRRAIEDAMGEVRISRPPGRPA